MTAPPDSATVSKLEGSTNRFLTASNLLSILRLLLAAPFSIVMLSGNPSGRLWGAIIMVMAALTDKYDGVLARKYGLTTQWGKVLDPLADKIGVAVVAIILLILGNIPLWFLLTLLVRDILIFSGGIYIRSHKGVILQSNELGKWTVGIVALALFLMVLNAQSILVEIFTWISTILLVTSFAIYVNRFIEVIKG